MIIIQEQDGQLLLRYEPDQIYDASWVDEKLKQDGSVTLRRTFTFMAADLVDNSDPENQLDHVRAFVLGTEDGDYFKIDRNILGLKYDLLLTKQMELSHHTFIANRDISVFRKIDELVNEPIVIGGKLEGSIPVADFKELLRNFPTSTELTYYASARITRTLRDYLGTISDAQKKLDNYLNQKRTIRSRSSIDFIKKYEIEKFEYIRDELKQMLKDSDSFPEKDWQKKVIGFLLILFPKYVAVLENLQIKDFYSDPKKVKDRFIDITLVDANGTIDIIEIKKPFANCILSRNRYRDSYTPRAELSGSVMQVEKYVFHLNKWGREGERIILEKRKDDLPTGFEIKITNPKAMIILGRDNDFAREQQFDFEIIKRKYANIIDIMTYDDLLRRLNNIIAMFQRRTP